ncbi:MAG: DNA primase [Psychroflexus halocasei]|uniref:DNA primase n=1 Tax=Psychroflexus sp. S27 TaxID=1982757 RepID=UPI000C2A6476|nr:DNA primase [Psychroflexus sp. S27]PJX23944.1 DNA primase [Psychroflexus sp. S27]
MISKSTIDKVFDAARVEEVIGDYVQLKKSGSNFKGLSPFSDERTPSFMVSPVKQIWKDFSSGKGGNAISFIMEHEHYSYPEAIRYLAKKYGIEIEETEQTDEEKEKASVKESMFAVSAFARDFFVKQLFKTDEGKSVGLSYFKERGFTNETIKKFELGYSPENWTALTDRAQKEKYQLDYLLSTGLTKKSGDRTYDAFRGRVIFPIHSMSGRVLGFGGRILDQSKKTAKYLNSPESEIYHKSKILYGLYQAKQSIAKNDNCLLVEGYTDVIQFNQSGLQNVVSSSGTALTPDQIRLIKRLTSNITVLFDGDAAGQRASLRGVDLILEQDMNVKICSFPEGEDPDSFARKNSFEEVSDFLKNNAQDFIQYKASLLAEEAQNDPVKTSELTRDIVESIAKIPDPIKQELYIKSCANIMQVSEGILFSTLDQMLNRQSKNKNKQQQKQPEKLSKVKDIELPKVDPQKELERIIIGLLFKYGSHSASFEDFEIDFDETGNEVLKPISTEHKVYEKIYMDLQSDEVEFTDDVFKDLYQKLIDNLSTQEKFEISSFINNLNTELASEATSVVMQFDKYDIHKWESQNIFVKDRNELEPSEVTETILNLRRILIHQKVEDMMKEIQNADDDQRMEILQETMEYKQLEVLIARKLNRII